MNENTLGRRTEMSTFHRLGLLATLVSAGLFLAGGASAQYPDKPISGIVGFAPGGTIDAIARVVAPKLGEKLGQTVVVENKPGAAGNIGMQLVAEAEPDGYTILFNASAATQNPAMYSKLPFDPVEDLVPVARIGYGPYVVIVNGDLPVKNLQELIALAKEKPGQLNAAAGGIATRLAVELFRIEAGLEVQIINYSGAGPAATSVLSGETNFAIMNTSAFSGQLSTGRIRALTVAGTERLSDFPDIPTTAESGLPSYIAGTVAGIFVPKGTPADIIEELHAAANEAIADPETAKTLIAQGVEPRPTSQAEFATQIRDEIAQWKDTVSRAKIPLLD
jgi:tripartite-type tricarboxylate transporter receptor subunit TctC